MATAAVTDHVRAFLVALIRYALLMETEPGAADRWGREAGSEQARLSELGTSGIHLDGVWPQAVSEAESEPSVQDANVSMTLPQTCPLSWDEIVAADFDLGSAARRIRESTATG